MLMGGLSKIASERVQLGTLRRHFAHVERFMDANERDTITLAQVECLWAMHEFTSHRRHVDRNYTDAAGWCQCTPTTRRSQSSYRMPVNCLFCDVSFSNTVHIN